MQEEKTELDEVIRNYQKWFDFFVDIPTEHDDKTKQPYDFYKNNFQNFAYIFFYKS